MFCVNPWHGVSPGPSIPECFTAVIEIPKGSTNKYELDKASGLLKVDRVLHSAVYYPANYGFIPQTYCDDHDPLDVLVLGQWPLPSLCLVEARAIGVMQMIDDNEEDDKIIAVHVNDPDVSHIQDISNLPDHKLHELRRFFEDYKALERKSNVSVERFMGRFDAFAIVKKALALYDEQKRELVNFPVAL